MLRKCANIVLKKILNVFCGPGSTLISWSRVWMDLNRGGHLKSIKSFFFFSDFHKIQLRTPENQGNSQFRCFAIASCIQKGELRRFDV